MLTQLVLATIVSSPAAPSDVHAKIEDAVRTGSSGVLRDARTSLKKTLTNTNNADTSSLYLLAYVDWRIGHVLWSQPNAKKERERILNEARSMLERHLKAQPNDGEAQVLLASVLGQLIAGDPDRGSTYGPRSAGLMASAINAAPNSPRVALLRGVWYLFMPAMYGGGLDEAQSELERASQLFERELPTAPWPNWGRMDVQAWLGQVAAKKGDRAKAKAIYQKTLSKYPDAVWIKNVLLPAVL